MTHFTERQKTIIINSFKKVFNQSDIRYIKNPAYQFLLECTDFNNHLSLKGFQSRFKDVSDLAKEIIIRTPKDENNNQCNEIFNEIQLLTKEYLNKKN